MQHATRVVDQTLKPFTVHAVRILDPTGVGEGHLQQLAATGVVVGGDICPLGFGGEVAVFVVGVGDVVVGVCFVAVPAEEAVVVVVGVCAGALRGGVGAKAVAVFVVGVGFEGYCRTVYLGSWLKGSLCGLSVFGSLVDEIPDKYIRG